ncbi:MAG: two-component regulator propeller domain-containing protein [Pyrinomonadaceae bacterium]
MRRVGTKLQHGFHQRSTHLPTAHRSLLKTFFILLTLHCSFLASYSAEPANELSQIQNTNLHQWGAVTLFHGLPSDRVRAIAQGPDGTMWFGTDGGLARYDGRRTQAVVDDGLPQGRVIALKVDADGTLWIGTEKGAARLVDQRFIPVKETAGKVITAIITPERGRALMTSEQGLVFDCRVKQDGALDVKTFPDEPLTSADKDHPGPLQMTSIVEVGGVFYIGTLSRGLMMIEGNQVKEVQSRPRSFFIQAVERDGRGQLWTGARARPEESGLVASTNPLQPARVGETTGTVMTLRAGVRGDVWAGTDGRGAFHFNGSRLVERFTFEGTAGGLRSDHIFSIFIDREDVVWFGTDKGVCRYDPHALRVENVSDDPNSNFVRALYQTESGQLLCGTNYGLFERASSKASTTSDSSSAQNQTTQGWRPLSEMARRIIYAMTEDAKGRLLVGTANGLYRRQKSTRANTNGDSRFERVEIDYEEGDEQLPEADSVRALAQFQGSIYVANFGRGLERLEEDDYRALVWPNISADARAREVVSLYAENDKRLWIGTASAGLFFFDGKEVKTEASLDALRDSPVWSIKASGNGFVWIATGRGLYSYTGAGELKLIVPNIDARAIAGVDKSPSNQIWCATAGAGLLKISLDEQFGPLISHVDAEQGLPSPRVFALLPDSAESSSALLLIGTSRGVARYEQGRELPALNTTRIIGKRVFQPEELRDGLKLEYPQNSLVLELNATSSRTFPEKFQYAFLLTDEKGRIIKQKLSHDAQFAMEGLHPGKYRVAARAFTVDLIASSPLSFEFTVAAAPFPRTTVALSILLALAIVALSWGYFQNRRINRTSAELMDANKQLASARLQLANETEAERRRIARDLHDQTLADLRHLLMLTDQLPGNGGAKKEEAGEREATVDPTVFRSEIESISTEVRRICEDLSPSVLENVGLAAALEWSLANAVAHSAPDCKFEYEFLADEGFEERIGLAPQVQMQIYRIVQEAVNNICRHAAATRVRLHVEITADGSFQLELEDNGRDFDPREKKKKQGRGLSNIRARASLIDAEVTWHKRTGGGTLFTLRKQDAARNASLTI